MSRARTIVMPRTRSGQMRRAQHLRCHSLRFCALGASLASPISACWGGVMSTTRCSVPQNKSRGVQWNLKVKILSLESLQCSLLTKLNTVPDGKRNVPVIEAGQ